MQILEQDVQPHHNWWAGLVSAGLDALRRCFKFDASEAATWDTVTGWVKSLL